MPEQISRYPDVTLKVLEGAGARCGEGAPQKILTQCPADQFCSLRSGEICVYGIDEIEKMTQIEPRDLAAVVCPAKSANAVEQASLTGSEAAVMAGVFVAGALLGKLGRRRER